MGNAPANSICWCGFVVLNQSVRPFAMASGDLEKLQYLALVSKVCTELENHLNVNDKDLAEFIVDLGKNSKDDATFRQQLADNGMKTEVQFGRNLYALIRRYILRTSTASGLLSCALAIFEYLLAWC